MASTGEPKRILVLDDSPDQVETLATLLTLQGHRVECATNPLYALTLLRGFSPEVVFVDIGMPQMDGYEVLRRLRKQFKSARVYAVTGRSDDDTARKVAEVGFDGCLIKPVDFSIVEKLLVR
jgi:two-component system, OmpR family, response regulator